MYYFRRAAVYLLTILLMSSGCAYVVPGVTKVKGPVTGKEYYYGLSDSEDQMYMREVRQHYVDTHPEEDIDIKKCVLKGEICKRMTPEAVLASRGDPQYINRSGGKEQWIYGEKSAEYHGNFQAAVYLYFENGKLVSWKEEREENET